MTLIKEYEAFLLQLQKHGYSEFDFIKFIRNYYFPRTQAQIPSREISEKPNPINQKDRDYSKYVFMGNKNLTKRKVIHSLISFLLVEKKISPVELNKFSKENRFTPMTRPLVNEKKDIPNNLLSRYFSKEQDLIIIEGKKYAIYNQFGGTGFDNLCKIFKRKYKVSVLKQA